MKYNFCLLVVLALFGLLVALPRPDDEETDTSKDDSKPTNVAKGDDKAAVRAAKGSEPSGQQDRGGLSSMIKPMMEMPGELMKDGSNMFSGLMSGFQQGWKEGMGSMSKLTGSGNKESQDN